MRSAWFGGLLVGIVLGCALGARAEEAASNDPVIQDALAAIEKQDMEALEGLRDRIQPQHVAVLASHWKASMAWPIKDAYVAVLMDQKDDVLRPMMEDALDSPSVDSRLYALCILKKDFTIFDSMMTPDGWADPAKVDAAVKEYRAAAKKPQ